MFKVIDNRLFVNTKLIVKPDSLSLIQEQNAMEDDRSGSWIYFAYMVLFYFGISEFRWSGI